LKDRKQLEKKAEPEDSVGIKKLNFYIAVIRFYNRYIIDLKYSEPLN